MPVTDELGDVREGRYAKVEREQRWTVAYLPADVRRAAEILDRYILDTCLRRRRVETNRDVVLKLGAVGTFCVTDLDRSLYSAVLGAPTWRPACTGRSSSA